MIGRSSLLHAIVAPAICLILTSGCHSNAGAGATIAGGAGATAMRNQNGVLVELTSTAQGANLKLAAEGIKLSVEKQ
jgi:hypothetical protein